MTISDDADEATGDDAPTIPVDCPDCGTTTRVSIDEVADALANHNDRLHDGEDVARVDPDLANAVADLAAEELGLTADDS